MKSAICTLFEGDYHYGVGALSNSLYANGYRGVIYAGYRGILPPWAINLKATDEYFQLKVAEELMIRFIKIQTNAHLTNFKPDFMLSVWNNHCPDAEGMFYFDPDIVIRCTWSYFNEWARSGIALCEDVNSPIPVTHPLRIQWARFYKKAGFDLNFTNDIYVNGGFQGIAKSYFNFLEDWQKVQEIMAVEIGGLEKTGHDIRGRDNLFSKTDQDALNITLGLTKQPLSVIGKEGMDFVAGGFTMSHTIGPYKAWDTNFIRKAFEGNPPSLAFKPFFENTQQPIRILSPQKLMMKKLSLKIASGVGRFYRRS